MTLLEEAAMRKQSETTGERESDSSSADVEVWRAAIAMFDGDRSAARNWLHQEAMGLGWRRPIDVMERDPQQVLDLITRIDRGVYT